MVAPGRWVGKPLYQTGTKEALKHGEEVVNAALGPSTTVYRGGDGRADGGAKRCAVWFPVNGS